MKRKIKLSIALVLSIVLVSLTSSDQAVKAEPPQRYRADSGIIKAGPNQKVRLTITGFGEDFLRVQFRQITYSQNACNDGVCRLTVLSQDTTDPIMVNPGEALAIARNMDDISDGNYRIVALSNSPNVRVNVSIINGITGVLVSTFALEIDGIPVGN